MNAGKNAYICVCGHTWKSDRRPEACPICSELYSFGPHYPASRVRGEVYTPYFRAGEWGDWANACMKDDARSNFASKQSC